MCEPSVLFTGLNLLRIYSEFTFSIVQNALSSSNVGTPESWIMFIFYVFVFIIHYSYRYGYG